jgi:hypothetical protein
MSERNYLLLIICKTHFDSEDFDKSLDNLDNL